ncbi:hypothetical protein [Ruegeria atlantica]|nr:hypothetical protein [Ruegeria atlantica]
MTKAGAVPYHARAGVGTDIHVVGGFAAAGQQGGERKYAVMCPCDDL